MKTKRIATVVCFILGVLVLASNLSALQAPKQPPAQNQTTSQDPVPKTLVINGRAAPNPVLLNGRSYADILAFAQLTGATISVLPDRIILTMPGANAATASPRELNPPQVNRLSREFARSAIPYVDDIRQWRNAIETVIGLGVPQSREVSLLLQQHRNRAEESLRLADLAASTHADRSALQLLQAEFSLMDPWDANATAARQNLDASPSVDPNTFQNDPILAKINNCNNFLGDMLSSGTFYDIGICR